MAIRVLIVDDSALIRNILAEILAGDPDIEVIGLAEDAMVARQRIKDLMPDVVTLDVDMPGMSGLQLLRNLARLHPLPVVMISSLTQKGSVETLEALELGAVDYVPKPVGASEGGLVGRAERIIAVVKAAAGAKVRRLDEDRVRAIRAAYAEGIDPAGKFGNYRKNHLLAIGASTGGVEAIMEVLLQMPPDCPPIVVTQHIPAGFSSSYARRLDACCAIKVHEACSMQEIRPGSAYLAPGSHHLLVRREGVRRICVLSDAAPVNRHRPSVEVMFDSVAKVQGPNCTAALLTGMGEDGAAGLLRLRRCGAHTIAQDRATAVVWGMPAAAVELGAAQAILPLDKIARAMLVSATTPADR